MHFRIAKLRIVPFLLQLIIRRSCEDAPQNHIFAYKVEDISVPTSHFIRNPAEVRFRIVGLFCIRTLMKACPRISFLRIIAEVSPSPRHILYAV